MTILLGTQKSGDFQVPPIGPHIPWLNSLDLADSESGSIIPIAAVLGILRVFYCFGPIFRQLFVFHFAFSHSYRARPKAAITYLERPGPGLCLWTNCLFGRRSCLNGTDLCPLSRKALQQATATPIASFGRRFGDFGGLVCFMP